jgi:pyrroline-5-carboxylate reductase
MAKSVKTPLKAMAGMLVLVGAGKMGSALLDGWFRLGVNPRKVSVLEPKPGKALAAHKRRGLRLNPSVKAIGPATVIVLAIKPQSAPEVLPSLVPLLGPKTVVVSIMAGRTIRFLERALPGAAIVRAMPNTPAAVARGISAAVAAPETTARQRAMADALLASIGRVEWIEDEALIDPVTAVSGSGPAYVFLLVECLAEAGAKAGLPAELAMRLARATIEGAGELLFRDQETEASTLRRNVTSPGGTTAAALEVLMASDGLSPLIERAVAAAARRARELAG